MENHQKLKAKIAVELALNLSEISGITKLLKGWDDRRIQILPKNCIEAPTLILIGQFVVDVDGADTTFRLWTRRMQRLYYRNEMLEYTQYCLKNGFEIPYTLAENPIEATVAFRELL